MADLVLRQQCNRCPATIERKVNPADIQNTNQLEHKGPASLEVRVEGEVIAKFDFLCESCREITAKYVQQIARQLDKKSSVRIRQQKERGAEDDTPSED